LAYVLEFPGKLRVDEVPYDVARTAPHEPGVIQVHAFAAMTAFLAALMQLALPKGTPRHRAVGYLWVALMLLVVIPSFWIHTIRQWGPWSWIHLLSIFTW
jgi:uncharacterized membrane protein